jgi:poly [ADP-ribose] polymerase
MANIVRKEKLIMADIDNNNNKVWIGTLFDNGDVTAEWGRVGNTFQTKTHCGVGSSFLDKKMREKENKGYKKLNVVEGSEFSAKSKSNVVSVSDVNLKKIAQQEINKNNNPIVKDLIDYLTRVNAHQIVTATSGHIKYNDTTGLFSTPLGIVTQNNIDDANDILVRIGDLVAKRKYDDELKSFTNNYLVLIPQDIGMKRLDMLSFWADLGKVQAQKQILDGLQTSLDKATSATPVKTAKTASPSGVFKVDLVPVSDARFVKDAFDDYYATRDKRHSCYNYKPKQMWEVNIDTMDKAFQNDGAKLNNHLVLVEFEDFGRMPIIMRSRKLYLFGALSRNQPSPTDGNGQTNCRCQN